MMNFINLIKFFSILLFTTLCLGVIAQSKNIPGFPANIKCTPQPVSKYNADGKSARLMNIEFIGAKLNTKAQIEVLANGIKEITEIIPGETGDSVCSILLPGGVSLEKDSKVTISLIQGKNKIKMAVNVPKLRPWTVYIYPHSHVDIGYTNTQKNVEYLHKVNILEGIKLAEATKDYLEGSRYRWNPEVTWPLERLWQSMPEEHEKVLKAIRDGYLCIDASYLNLNTSVCSDEEMFHAFDFSRKIQKLTGKPIDVFQQFDIPGISWGLVPVLAQQGIKYILSWPNYERSGNAHKNIDQRPFWWVGPDGKSKVLFLQPGIYANSGSMDKSMGIGRSWFGQRDPGKVPPVIKVGYANVDFSNKLLDLENDNYPYNFMVLSWCLWDNSPLDADVPDAVKDWNEKHEYPKLIIAGGHEIMESIEKQYGLLFPTIKGDYTEYWTDGLGTASKLSAMNRNSKERLTQAEKLWSMLSPMRPAPRAEFEEAWRYLSLGSEHTWCNENPTEPFFLDAIFKVKQGYFREANDRSQELFDDALAPVTDKSDGALGPEEGPSAGGIAVFNTNSWNHSGLITLTVAESVRGDCVVDEENKKVPSQRLSTGELVFMASNVPALGSRHFRVTEGKFLGSGTCKIQNTSIENEFLRVVINSETGNITQLVTLATNRNFSDEKENGGLNAFRWLPANIYAPKADSNIVITTIESGPLVVELNVKSQGVGCRSVNRSIRLIAGQPWVEISNTVDKLPLLAKDGIHFGFGFNIPQGRTRVDIPWGVMEVEKDQWAQANRNYIAMQRWLDISNDKEGITWCSLDAPLFEYGNMTANISTGWGGKGPWLTKLEPSSTIYSWVMNNHWHTNFPLTQDGTVNFRYRILPHGEYSAVEANHFGMEQSQPLAHVTANNNPNLKPLISFDNDKVCVTIIKTLDDGKTKIVRLRSLSEKAENVKLAFPFGMPKSVQICSLEEIPEQEAGESVTLLPYGLITLHIAY